MNDLKIDAKMEEQWAVARKNHYSRLQSYSELSVCIKCGCSAIKSLIRKVSSYGNWYAMNTKQREIYCKSAYEVIERACPRCAHSWYEKPLDAC